VSTAQVPEQSIAALILTTVLKAPLQTMLLVQSLLLFVRMTKAPIYGKEHEVSADVVQDDFGVAVL
jgi:hypothetical protein